MKLRPQHLAALREQGIESAHRSDIEALREQGFHVDAGGRPGELFVRDAAGSAATIELRGRFTRTTTAEGRVIETEQYPKGRIRTVRDPLGHSVVFERDTDGFLTAIDRGDAGGRFGFELNPDWKPKRIDYPDGTFALTEYDAASRPVRVTDRAGFTAKYERNAAGDLVSITDVRGQRTSIEYSGWSSPSAVVQADGTRHEFEYDSEGRLGRFSVGSREHGRYRFDEETGFHEAHYHDGSWVRLRIEGGRITHAENEHGTVELAYDDAGRLLSEAFAGATVNYERDPVGGLVALSTSSGERIAYERDHDQRLVAVRDWAGLVTRIRWPAAGPPSRIEYPNATVVEQIGDELGRLASWTLNDSRTGQGGARSYRWQYDACDRVIAEDGSGAPRQFVYDRAGRVGGVVSVDRWFEESFELDPSGNRLQDGGLACDYDSCNRLLQRGLGTCAYDPLGNATRLGEWTFRYDARGHLLEASRHGVVVHFAYDALGRRILKHAGSQVTRYRWAGAQLLSEETTDGDTKVRRDYLVAPEFPAPFAMRVGEEIYRFHTGRRHEVLSMTDPTGAVVWEGQYRSFGQARVAVSRVSQPWRLAGQYFDDETGLHYVGARYLSPLLGRFLTPDPLGPESHAQNLYLLCDGDPLNRIDPSGEIGLTLGTVLTAMAIGAVVGAAIGAGIELYKQRNQPETDWGQVGRAALIGGCIGAIGAAVGAIGTAVAATVVGGVAAGAIGGGVAAGVEYCVEAAGSGEFSWKSLALSVAVGAGAGAGTAGIGSVVAARAARKAAQVTEEAARKALREAEEEAARRAILEAEARAAREATKGVPKVIVKEGKWDYFFGKVKSNPHNESRSLQNAKDLKTLGIDEASGGRERLMQVFEEGLTSPETGRHVTQYGTTITRTVQVPPKGAVDVKYFYPGGDTSAAPEISTIIPKIF